MIKNKVMRIAKYIQNVRYNQKETITNKEQKGIKME